MKIAFLDTEVDRKNNEYKEQVACVKARIICVDTEDKSDIPTTFCLISNDLSHLFQKIRIVLTSEQIEETIIADRMSCNYAVEDMLRQKKLPYRTARINNTDVMTDRLIKAIEKDEGELIH